jgi:hypothetical protein
MTTTNKLLLISESRGDLNRCTPCRGKSDQHDTYASHASPHTSSVRFLRAVPVRGNISRGTDRFGQISLLLRKRVSNTIHSTPADRSAGPFYRGAHGVERQRPGRSAHGRQRCPAIVNGGWVGAADRWARTRRGPDH